MELSIAILHESAMRNDGDYAHGNGMRQPITLTHRVLPYRYAQNRMTVTVFCNDFLLMEPSVNDSWTSGSNH